jgi:hypothetical protein
MRVADNGLAGRRQNSLFEPFVNQSGGGVWTRNHTIVEAHGRTLGWPAGDLGPPFSLVAWEMTAADETATEQVYVIDDDDAPGIPWPRCCRCTGSWGTLGRPFWPR